MYLKTKRVLTILLGVLTVLSVVSCKDNTATTTTTTAAFTGSYPTMSTANQDQIFYQKGDYVVTYGDIYEDFKINDGINRLLFMIDTNLLSTYITNVTQDQIDEKIKYLTYGTTDDDEIAAMDPADKADYESNYEENMFLLGYSGNEEVYIRMVCAKEAYARYAMTLEANNEESWYDGPSTIASYYDSTYYEDLSAIKIRFYSETDAKNVLKAFNLVSMAGTLRLYTGTKPIDEVPSSNFNDTNTVALSGEEMIAKFLEMYNYVYGGFRDEIATDSTVAELLTEESLKINYLDLSSSSTNLATFMFETMGSYDAYVADPESNLYYTYAPVKYYGTNDTSYYMILNLDRATKADVSDFEGTEADLVSLIGQDVYDEIHGIIEENNIATSGYIADRIADLRKENNLVIYDYYLGIDYQAIDSSYELNEEGSTNLVASIDGLEITADQLFAYALELNPGLYTIYASQLGISMDEYYAQVYCPDDSVACETNIGDNNSTKMQSHRTDLADLKESFESSYYVYYYTFPEYIYLAYGAKSEEDMLAKYYVKATLQPYMVYDELQNNDWDVLVNDLYAQVQENYDNYFSLNVDHLLIYVDRDEDGVADDYDEFLSSLTDQTAYDNLLADFEVAIRTYLNASTNNSFSSLITEYAKAKRTNETWGAFKNYGFCLMTEDLSSSGSLDYPTSKGTYEQPFVDGLIATYQQYTQETNKSKSYLYYDGDVQTSYGVHLIYATKGTDFTKPTALFEMTYDTEGNPNYAVGIENDSAMPTIEQLKIYSEYRFDQIVYGTDDDAEETYGFTFPAIPTSVLNALDAYFGDIHDSMYVIGFINVIVANYLQDGTFVNENTSYCSWTDAAIKENVAGVGEIYFNQLFPETDN